MRPGPLGRHRRGGGGSVAALTRAEIEGDMGDSHVGLLARLMSQALRNLARFHRQDQLHFSFIFINQLREKVG